MKWLPNEMFNWSRFVVKTKATPYTLLLFFSLSLWYLLLCKCSKGSYSANLSFFPLQVAGGGSLHVVKTLINWLSLFIMQVFFLFHHLFLCVCSSHWLTKHIFFILSWRWWAVLPCCLRMLVNYIPRLSFFANFTVAPLSIVLACLSLISFPFPSSLLFSSTPFLPHPLASYSPFSLNSFFLFHSMITFNQTYFLYFSLEVACCAYLLPKYWSTSLIVSKFHLYRQS